MRCVNQLDCAPGLHAPFQRAQEKLEVSSAVNVASVFGAKGTHHVVYSKAHQLPAGSPLVPVGLLDKLGKILD